MPEYTEEVYWKCTTQVLCVVSIHLFDCSTQVPVWMLRQAHEHFNLFLFSDWKSTGAT